MDSNYIKDTPLDPKGTAGQVGEPSIGGDYAFGGITKSASVTGPTGEVETTASQENLSAKFKNPQVKQDIPPLADNQYEAHN